jgi:hypothetical protein
MVVEFSERSLLGLARRGALFDTFVHFEVLLALRLIKQRKHFHVVVLEAHTYELAIATEIRTVDVLRKAEALY